MGMQKIHGVTGKFGLGVQNEEGQRPTELCQENTSGPSKHPLPTAQDSTHGHHETDNIEIRLIIFSAAED